jgi:hypothetical protein
MISSECDGAVIRDGSCGEGIPPSIRRPREPLAIFGAGADPDLLVGADGLHHREIGIAAAILDARRELRTHVLQSDHAGAGAVTVDENAARRLEERESLVEHDIDDVANEARLRERRDDVEQLRAARRDLRELIVQPLELRRMGLRETLSAPRRLPHDGDRTADEDERQHVEDVQHAGHLEGTLR